MTIKDYGNWNVPTCWDEVTLAQLSAIDKERALEEPSLVRIVAIMAGRDVSEVEQLPVEFVNMILSKMEFIRDAPSIEPSCRVEIGGEVYQVNPEEKLRFGEFVAVDSVRDGDIAKILAVVCRKPGELYDSMFENEVLESRIAMFSSAPCTRVLPLFAFFLELWMVSSELSRNYLTVKDQVLSLIQRLIENSRKDGGGRSSLTSSQTRKLKRLRKFVERTY